MFGRTTTTQAKTERVTLNITGQDFDDLDAGILIFYCWEEPFAGPLVWSCV